MLAQEWLSREDDSGVCTTAAPAAKAGAAGAAVAGAACLRTRTPSLEQAGGLQRMTLRGHTGGVSKVLLAPGGIDVITGARARSEKRLCDFPLAPVARPLHWACPKVLLAPGSIDVITGACACAHPPMLRWPLLRLPWAGLQPGWLLSLRRP
jgi:hypothetical protein